jgi:tellurite resistance protein TerC
LIQRFHWIFYLLGAFLIYSGIRLGLAGEHQIDPANNWAVRAFRRVMPVAADYHGSSFFVRGSQGGRALYATPLLIVLVVIETTDLLFAVDSIPAVMAITLNAFIVYASNVFAIISLRSLFFAVSGLMKVFRFLHYGLALLLILMGLKMIAENYLKVSTLVMLATIAAILLISIVASLTKTRTTE